eukprot:sb/3477810/
MRDNVDVHNSRVRDCATLFCAGSRSEGYESNNESVSQSSYPDLPGCSIYRDARAPGKSGFYLGNEVTPCQRARRMSSRIGWDQAEVAILSASRDNWIIKYVHNRF